MNVNPSMARVGAFIISVGAASAGLYACGESMERVGDALVDAGRSLGEGDAEAQVAQDQIINVALEDEAHAPQGTADCRGEQQPILVAGPARVLFISNVARTAIVDLRNGAACARLDAASNGGPVLDSAALYLDANHALLQDGIDPIFVSAVRL